MLGGVPQSLAIARPGRNRCSRQLRGKKDFRVEHVAPTAVIDQLTATLVPEPLAGTIGGGRCRATASAARYRTNLQPEYRHGLSLAAHDHPQPHGRARCLQVSAEIGKLLELRGQNRCLSDLLLAYARGAARMPDRKTLRAVAGT